MSFHLCDVNENGLFIDIRTENMPHLYDLYPYMIYKFDDLNKFLKYINQLEKRYNIKVDLKALINDADEILKYHFKMGTYLLRLK